MIVTYTRGDYDFSAPVFVRRYDARRGTPLGKPLRVAPRSTTTVPIMSPDGRLLVSTDDRATYAIDAETLRVIRRYPVGEVKAVSPDGRTVAISATDGPLRLLDLASGRVRTLSAGPGPALEPRAFSPDGRTLATSEDTGSVILWDVEKGVTTETLEGHADITQDSTHAFSPDGRTLYTASNDGRVIVWDVAGDRRLGRPFPTGYRFEGGFTAFEAFRPAFALSPDGRALAVARPDGRVELIDAETLRRTASFEAFPGRAALAIDYSADGRRLAVAGQGGGVGVWDVESGEQLGALLRAPRGPGAVNPRTVDALAFGQGDLLAAAEVGGAVRIWDVGRRELLRPPLRLPPSVHGLAFSPDGSQLAIPFGAFSAEAPNGVEILDVGSGERVARPSTDGEVVSVAFSPDGSLLAGGEVDGGALLWSTGGWRLAGRPLALRNASTLEVEFSPDGHTLATSHDLGSAVLWDVASQEPIGPPLPGGGWGSDSAPQPAGGGGTYVSARFTADGARLFVVIRTRARDPLGGRSRRLEAAGLPADGRRPYACRVGGDHSGPRLRRGLPLRLDGRPPRAPNRSSARIDRAWTDRCTERIPLCRSLLAVNRHRASTHREARREAITPRRPEMRANTKGKHEMGRRFAIQGRRSQERMRKKIAAVLLAGAFALSVPSAASALAPAPGGALPGIGPVPETFSLSFSGSIKCDGFKDQFTDVFDARAATYFDSAGNPIRYVIHAEHHSDDTNSVTGLTLHEHGMFTETIDLLAGTDTITGIQEIMNRPGTGIVVQDVGKVVYDSNGDLVFFAGGRKHSEIFLGDQVLCDALA